MNLLNIKNILIDFGGVLYQIDPMNSIIEFSKISGISKEILASTEFYNNNIAPFEKGICSEDDFRVHISKILKINLSPKEFDEIWLKTLIKIFPDSLSIIENLKKQYKLFLLSNTNILHYKKFSIECESLFKIFDKTYFSFKIGLLKPEKKIFRYVESDADINPFETLFIDDTLANIKSAEELGYHTLYLSKRELLSKLLHNV